MTRASISARRWPARSAGCRSTIRTAPNSASSAAAPAAVVKQSLSVCRATLRRLCATQFALRRLAHRNGLAEEAMRRIAMIGAAVLIGYGLPAPASADGVPPKAVTAAPVGPGCHCPLVHRRVHARVRHYRAVPLAPRAVLASPG